MNIPDEWVVWDWECNTHSRCMSDEPCPPGTFARGCGWRITMSVSPEEWAASGLPPVPWDTGVIADWPAGSVPEPGSHR